MGNPVVLYTVPFAGSGAGQYRAWANDLPAWVQIAPARLPGREQRLADSPLKSIEDNARQLLERDRPARAGSVLALFGQSFGALVAYELAHRSPQTTVLVVVASAPPKGRGIGLPLHKLPRSSLLARLRRMGSTQYSQELFDLMEPTLRADLEACETYVPDKAAPLACPIIAIAGSNDRTAPPEAMLDWRSMTNGPFSLHVVEGGHFHPQENREDFLGVLREVLLPLHQPASDRSFA